MCLYLTFLCVSDCLCLCPSLSVSVAEAEREEDEETELEEQEETEHRVSGEDAERRERMLCLVARQSLQRSEAEKRERMVCLVARQSGPESGTGVGGGGESGLLTVARDTALFQVPLVILLRLRNQTQNKKAFFLIKALLIGI